MKTSLKLASEYIVRVCICSFPLKIRELLDRELDDGLLDDDNASFSSHDLRSSGYSRDTPFSEDFSEQAPQAIFNGQDSRKIIPSERGAFERPPLMTQRAFHFINGSGKTQDLNMNGVHEPYNYNAGHQYENHYGNQGHYYRDQESPYDGDVDGYKQNYDGNEDGVNDYQMLPNDDDVDEGFEQYGNYSPHQTMQGQVPTQQDSYHYHSSQPNYPHSNFNKDNSSSGGHDFNEDYRGYIEEGTYEQDPVQNIYGNSTENMQYANEQNHYRIDTPGNYRVRYEGQQDSFPRASDRGSDRHEQERNDIENGFSEDVAQGTVQLQILYKARGRKIEELVQKLQNQEEEMAKEIRILNHQNAMIKGNNFRALYHIIQKNENKGKDHKEPMKTQI